MSVPQFLRVPPLSFLGFPPIFCHWTFHRLNPFGGGELTCVGLICTARCFVRERPRLCSSLHVLRDAQFRHKWFLTSCFARTPQKNYKSTEGVGRRTSITSAARRRRRGGKRHVGRRADDSVSRDRINSANLLLHPINSTRSSITLPLPAVA